MLAAERGAAANTIAAYTADLTDFAAFAAIRGHRPAAAPAETLHAYMAGLNARRAVRPHRLPGGCPACASSTDSSRVRPSARTTPPRSSMRRACRAACRNT